MADTEVAQPAATAQPEETSTAQVNGADDHATSDPPSDTKPADATVEDATDAADKEDEMDADGDKDTATDAAALDKVATNGTPASNKKKAKRPSTGVPEHKSKKLGKKKSMPNLNLSVQPGEMYYARMKGHPPWPAIICDEQMLPETLLSRRPVSAAYPNGTYRPDFEEGGKNAKDRRYPVMFLGTNEFVWLVNTDLQPIDLDEVKQMVEKDEQGKKSKALWQAYEVAAEGHDLDHFKNMLASHEEETRKKEQERERKDAEAKAKKEKAAKRKSKGAADEDVEMEDAADEPAEEKKSSKKRKKAADSEGETEKPVKTPKTKLKIKAPKETPEDSASKPKRATKPKKTAAKPKAASEDEAEEVQEEPAELTEEQKRERREKAVLYLRHKLQKGFISRDHPPVEAEMTAMNEHMNTLENYLDLEPAVIKHTKINKVLRAILKIPIIPKDSEFKFKERCTKLLNEWNKVLQTDAGATPTTAEAPVNGVAHDEEEKPAEGKSEKSEPAETPVDKTEPEAETKEIGDVSMTDAKEEAPAATDGDAKPEETAKEETAAA